MVGHDQKIAMLKRVPLFEHCTAGELDTIIELATEVSVPAGGKLTVEGDWGREFYVLLDGAAEVTQKGRVVNSLSAGDFLGEITLVHDRPRTASATATTASHLLIIAGSDFRRLMRDDPSIQAKVLDAVATRLAGDD